jgi:hypothetical protein
MAKQRSTAEYGKTMQVISGVIRKWDPYNLIAGGAPANEFDPQVSSLMTYVDRFRSREDVVSALSSVFSRAYDPSKFTPAFCSAPGAEIHEELIRYGLIKRVGGGGHFLDGVREWYNATFKK